MATPGLLYVLSKPKHASFSESDFNTWYTSHHIQDVVNSGLADLAIRYKNTSPDAKWPYLALYRLPDVAKLQDPNVMASIPKKHDLLPEGKEFFDVLDTDMRPFVLLQKFEGQVAKEGPRGKALRTVLIEPAEGSDDEFDEWYRKQHLDMLSMVSGFRRSTRYKLVPESAALGHPRYLACHEYDDKNFPLEQVKLVTGTEWSKKNLGSAKKFEGDVWEEIGVAGDVESKL